MAALIQPIEGHIAACWHMVCIKTPYGMEAASSGSQVAGTKQFQQSHHGLSRLAAPVCLLKKLKRLKSVVDDSHPVPQLVQDLHGQTLIDKIVFGQQDVQLALECRRVEMQRNTKRLEILEILWAVTGGLGQ